MVTKPNQQNYYVPGGLEGKIILDPMMGGGTTLHEAIRLGANVIGADIDPIPVVQARATLSDVALEATEKAFDHFFAQLYAKLGHYFRADCPHCQRAFELRFVLYGLKKQCACQQALFVDAYTLRHNSDNSLIHINPDNYSIYHDDTLVSHATVAPDFALLPKNKKKCDQCGEVFYEDTSVAYYQRYMPIAIMGECTEHGIFFAAPSQTDLDLIAQADAKRGELAFQSADFSILNGPKSADLLRRNITTYLDLFSSRQLLYLHHAMTLLEEIEHDVRIKLALLISTATEFNSMLCGYKGARKQRPGAIRHTFAYHAYSFPHTALENNPLHRSRSSGTLHNLFQSRLARGRKWAIAPIERHYKNGKQSKVTITGEIDAGTEHFTLTALQEGTHRFMLLQGSSANLQLPDNCVDHIVTDPPYFDSVQYGDLAAFFRVWLKRFLPTEANWAYELADAAVDQHANGNGQYVAVLPLNWNDI
ncbi:MAG TPA: hypothetical protein ENJ56_00945 [Anaerolineae bacterium]|nr:hypothetical protein [Anaerolineae bacterium]